MLIADIVGDIVGVKVLHSMETSQLCRINPKHKGIIWKNNQNEAVLSYLLYNIAWFVCWQRSFKLSSMCTSKNKTKTILFSATFETSVL
jgi:hypothetical protein